MLTPESCAMGHLFSWSSKKPCAEKGSSWLDCEGSFLWTLTLRKLSCFMPSDNLEHSLPSQWYSRSSKIRDFPSVLQNVCAILSTVLNCFWLKTFFVLDYFCVLVFKTHISHIFSNGLAAWRVSPEHVLEYWSIHPALLILPKSCWEKDIPGGETFDQPSTCTYIISLIALYHT